MLYFYVFYSDRSDFGNNFFLFSALVLRLVHSIMAVRPPSGGPALGQAEIEAACSDPFAYMSDYTKKKIRNLEKRKTKLEGYKEKLKQGEQLTKDQQIAGRLFGHFFLVKNFSVNKSDLIIYLRFPYEVSFPISYYKS